MSPTENTAVHERSALDRALAKIAADGARDANARTADDDRAVTVSVPLLRENGDKLLITLTGIAPFTAEPTVGHLTGVKGWTVLGQPYASRYGERRTISTAIHDRQELFGGMPLLRESEARQLADVIASTLQQKAA